MKNLFFLTIFIISTTAPAETILPPQDERGPLLCDNIGIGTMDSAFDICIPQKSCVNMTTFRNIRCFNMHTWDITRICEYTFDNVYPDGKISPQDPATRTEVRTKIPLLAVPGVNLFTIIGALITHSLKSSSAKETILVNWLNKHSCEVAPQGADTRNP